MDEFQMWDAYEASLKDHSVQHLMRMYDVSQLRSEYYRIEDEIYQRADNGDLEAIFWACCSPPDGYPIQYA